MFSVSGCEDCKVQIIDTTFEKSEGPAGLKAALDRTGREVAMAVKAGAELVLLQTVQLDQLGCLHRCCLQWVLYTSLW